MFWLKKLLGSLLGPLPIGLLLMLTGAVLWWKTRRKRLGKTLLLLGFAIPLIASNRGIAERMISRLEDQYPPTYKLEKIRYVAVLGGGHADNTDLPWSAQLGFSSRARLMEAVRLSRQNPQSVLICCGPQGDRTHSHAKVLGGAAMELGINGDNIELMPDGRDTYEEIQNILAFVGEEPVALVTSAWHMPRAMGIARKAGLNAVACPADYLSPLDELPLRMWFEFSFEGLGKTSRACTENLGLLWTALRGQR